MGAPLLDSNNGLLLTDKDANSAVIERAAKWASLCGADKVTELPKVISAPCVLPSQLLT